MGTYEPQTSKMWKCPRILDVADREINAIVVRLSELCRTLQDADNALTPDTVEKPLAGAGAASANAASRQRTNPYYPKFHMHIIDISISACENFPAWKSAAKGALWTDPRRYPILFPCAHVFRMSPPICFVFVLWAQLKFRFLSLLSMQWFSNVFCAFGSQVVQYLVTFILKVHLEESRRKKYFCLLSSFSCLKFCAVRPEYSIDR